MSGWGGILAAMAQGLGTGIVKNVEQGWKSEETDKMLDWRTKESDKQRAFESEQLDKKHQHDFALEDHKSRNAISEAAAKARISAQYSKSGTGVESEAQKDLTGAMQVLGVYDTQLNALNEKLANTEDKAQKEVLMKRIDNLSNERANYLKQPGTIATFKGADQMGRALYMTSGGDTDLFNPKPVTPTIPESKPVISAPTRNMVDTNNMTPEQIAQIAKQKQEEQAGRSFVKASNEAKEWAAKRNQYTPSTFIPRPF
ncbi:hypothetical protein HYE54_01060 [Aggregatibacter actinomycetemcomitans]|uniref:hypothetical protein n=1 Tax=Aggregatibacter actinomycetemcomitans TaxID=714 RepID=UPI00197BC3EC|nr:hypothetical protein [Aggregatibacter actinomycetemcomitans]MBN6067407.1 hypothetical protein [Aggregatibacter actinomycetemcomitans]MBN6086091.1 hypothetical protein [Aggregatibacter actinomycetemcomitans]